MPQCNEAALLSHLWREMKAGNTSHGTEMPLAEACEGPFEAISTVLRVLVKTCEGTSGGVLHETGTLCTRMAVLDRIVIARDRSPGHS